MDERVVISTDPGPPSHPPRGLLILVVVALAAIGALVALGSLGGSGSVAPEAGSLPDLAPDPLQTARRVVAAFETAWNRGEAAAIDDLVAEDWDSIELPGFADPWFEPTDGRRALTDAVAFLSKLTRLSLGSCEAEDTPFGSRATAVVRCREAAFQGDYLDAVRRNIWADSRAVSGAVGDSEMPGMTFVIREDRIVGVEGTTGGFTPQAYCIWAEEARLVAAASLFDLDCLPSTAPETAAAHAEAARAFMAAGAPLPALQLADARLAASYVDRFVAHHNIGDTFTLLGWLAPDVPSAGLPGFAGAADAPRMPEFLAWSVQLIHIDPGRCTVELGDGGTIVTCPDLTVSGPLLSEPLSQPTRFVVTSSQTGGPVARAWGRIVEIAALSDADVPVEGLCLELRRSHPYSASQVFTGDCTPVYTGEAAQILAVALESR